METYGLPENAAKKLTKRQLHVLEKYSTKSKRAAVIRWRQRMAKAGIRPTDLAAAIKKPVPRISEWLHFKYEPSESAFLKVEDAIYKLGG